mgnify:FL=1
MTIRPTSIPLLLAVLLAASPAPATITYIDAVEGTSGNTFATAGSLSDTSWVGPNS